MKKIKLLVLLFISASSFGKIWIVDSNSGSTAKDFTTLKDAHDGATAGDTLYLIGSPVNYITTRLTLTKRLVIIGPGYFLSENPDTQTNINSAFINNTEAGVCEELELAPGAEGSVLMGLEIFGRVIINVNNVLFKRNHIRQEGGCNSSMLIINGSNVLVVQNFIDGNLNASNNPVVEVGASKSGILLSNNFIFHSCEGCGGGVLALSSPASSSLEISNNIFIGGLSASNSLIQNNYFHSNNVFSAPSSLVRNNIHAYPNLPAGNGNIINITPSSTFVGTGSTDGKWKLKTGSPALGAGFGGTDCGIFGGAEPYILSGIPPIPTIYSLTAPSVGEKNTGLPVQVKVKSNN